MRFTCILLVLCLCAFAALGQTDRGTITGTVSDPAGAVVANAPIEVKNAQTGATFQAASSESGNFTLPQMPLGTYELTVTVPGFKKFVRQNITVQATQTIRIDAALEVGSATESVTVNAETSLLKTESGDVSTNVTGDRLVNLGMLPIGNGFSSSHGVRNPMAVAGLAPGTYFDPNLQIRVNGAPSNTESVRVDGQDATNGVVTFSQAQTQPSVEAIQELSIQTSNYAAEYGQAGSGVFNYTTKSGTNQFHGSLYNYNSNEAYNASQAYSHSHPKLRRNDYGGTLGGPVYIPKIYNGHDRTFFFWNYEEFREKNTISNITVTVPTAAYRAGDFTKALSGKPITNNPKDVTGQFAIDGQIFDPNSQFIAPDNRRVRLPFVGNKIDPTRFDPSYKKIVALIPLPEGPTAASLANNYNHPYPTDRTTPIPALKIDHSLSSRMKISGYWSTTETAVQYCTPLCGSEGFPNPITATRGTFIESHTERINFDYTVTPTMLLHIGAGYQHNDFKDTAPTTDFDVLGTLGIAGATNGPTTGARFPVFNAFTGSNSQGGMSTMGPAAGQSRSIELKPTGNISLSWVKSNHTYKFGGEGRTEGYPTLAPNAASGNFTFSAEQTANPWFSDAVVTISGGTTGFPYASFMLGRVSSYNLGQPTATRGGRKFLGFFAQDTWKVTRKLTLDYGLRWDYFGYSREQYGRTPSFSPTVINATAGGHPGGSIFEGDGPGHCGCDFGHNYPYAFGPRLGIAYQINPKTVLRAGVGVAYSSSSGGGQGAAGANQNVNAPGFGDPAMILSGGFTNTVNGVTVPVKPIWPDLRANLFPAAGSFSGAPIVTDNHTGWPARQLQWSIGIQREITRDLVVEAAYVANRGVWWRTNTLTSYNALSFDTLKANGLDITSAADRSILGAQIGQAAAKQFQNKLPFAGFPTNFSVARSLTPFPQFANSGPPGTAIVGSSGPLGKTWYDSLQAKVTKRLSHGLDATYTFTYSKELQLGADTDGGGGNINDIFNRDTNKQLSSFSRPFVNQIALNYTAPKWGRNKYLQYAVSDWNLATSLGYVSGLPILVPGTVLTTSNLSTTLLRGTRAQRVPGVPLFLQDLNCHCFDPAQTQVLNPAAWTDPTPGTFSPSAAYYNDYRFRRRPTETMSFGRIFRIKERVTFAVRLEMVNVFNRTQIPNPVAIGYSTAIATITAPNGLKVNNTGFGAIATLPNGGVIGERSGLLVGRFQF